MPVERKNYPHLEQPVGTYVHAVKHAGVLYVSGLTAFGSRAEGRSMAEQAEVVMEGLAGIAAAEGTDLGALLKVTVFVTTLEELSGLRAVLARHYGSHFPASSLVQVAGLFSPKISLEIEAVLAVGDG